MTLHVTPTIMLQLTGSLQVAYMSNVTFAGAAGMPVVPRPQERADQGEVAGNDQGITPGATPNSGTFGFGDMRAFMLVHTHTRTYNSTRCGFTYLQ